MPGLPDDKQQQLSLPSEVSTVGDNASAPLPQPRQPHNLQGLLRFAMQAHQQEQEHQEPAAAAASPTLQPLDRERQEFLQQALKSMTVDVIAVMKENITKLQNVANIPREKVPESIEAFENILEHIDNVDIANDFHKINGFSIFEPCFKCSHPEVRAHVCTLIAELAQNNPYIQEVICECTSVVPSLLQMLREDPSNEVQIKALYAISCITRESNIGYDNFKMHNGLETMERALEQGSDKLRTKAAFLLNALCHLDENILNDMLSMSFLQVIIVALRGEHQSSHEHLLSLLKLLLEQDPSGKGKLDDALKQELREMLHVNLQFVHGKEEFTEEEEYCKQIQGLIS